MLLRINPQNPQQRLIERVVECLRGGGVIIYPTDTVYGLGCDIKNKRAIERLAQLKGTTIEKANFACILADLSDISEYAVQISTPVYKTMKRALPGPYTFILRASKTIPHFFVSNKKTVGIRVVDHSIPSEIVRQLGNPIVTTSLRDEDLYEEYFSDPELIHERYKGLVDIVIDGGYGGLIPSTIIDCSEDEFKVIREGLGPVDFPD